jgi:hypothetical protein
MNILFLSNSAPNYHFFFNGLAKAFQADGAKVVVAVDSRFSRAQNRLDTLGFDIHEFASYFSKHSVDERVLARYEDFNLNAALLPDFERAQVYGISGKKDETYFDRLKSALLCFFEEIFKRYRIDVVLYENVSNAFEHFAFFVAQKKGAVYCGVGGSRLPGRFSIGSDPLHDEEAERIFHGIRAGKIVVSAEVRQWCIEYLANIETITPDYMKINGLDNTSLLNKYARINRIPQVLALIRHARDDSEYPFQLRNPLRSYFNLFLRNVARRIKLGLLEKRYEVPVDGEQFLLYPLHFHPEASTSVLAGTYLNEYEVIRNIAFNLPQGLKLYVKDHVSAWGYPSLGFYEQLMRLPNVRLLHPRAPTKQLIKRSRAVITLTGTVGYEALLLGKKVFLFGNVFYGFHRNIVRVSDPAKLFELLGSNLENDAVTDLAYTLDFLGAYYLSTLPGLLNLMQQGDAAEEHARRLYPLMLGKCAIATGRHEMEGV